MSVTALITATESDVYNSLSPDWLALTDTVKDAHILTASLYMQTNWSCTDVEWDDTDTLDDDLKRACAYYADADSQGTLYNSVSDTSAKGRIIEESGSVGSLSETIRYAEDGITVSGSNNLESIHALMSLHCTRTSGCCAMLVRV